MPELEHAEVVNFVILLPVGNCTMKSLNNEFSLCLN